MRAANLIAVAGMWRSLGYSPMIISDGGMGNDQFNRSRAYNIAISHCPDTQVFVFAESDMIVHEKQVRTALWKAVLAPGLVVPFTQYRYLSPKDSAEVRGGSNPRIFEPESIMDNGESVGAINVVSRETIELVGGFDEGFTGSWHDDIAMEKAFRICAGPTRWVDGPAFHLYHKPGWTGDHLSDEDRAATRANKDRLTRYEATENPDEIRKLVAEGR